MESKKDQIQNSSTSTAAKPQSPCPGLVLVKLLNRKPLMLLFDYNQNVHALKEAVRQASPHVGGRQLTILGVCGDDDQPRVLRNSEDVGEYYANLYRRKHLLRNSDYSKGFMYAVVRQDRRIRGVQRRRVMSRGF